MEYLDQLLAFLQQNGLDPADLVFSGFDGKSVAAGEPPARHNAIYVMNESGWRHAVNIHGDIANPAEYAERYEELGAPCLGLYDKSQLTSIYAHDTPEHPANRQNSLTDDDSIHFEGSAIMADEPDEAGVQYFDQVPYNEYITEREEFINIVPGAPLAELPADQPLEIAVIHSTYMRNPDASPTDALVGLVFLEQPQQADSSGFDF